MIIFSFHLSLAPLTNALTYIIPQDSINDFKCRMKALLHIISLLLTSNMFFLYYFLNFIMFYNPSCVNSNKLQITVYVVNWIIMAVFIGINAMQTPVLGQLNICRYDTSSLIPLINTGYLGVVSGLTLLLFILLMCNIKKFIQKGDDDDEINNYKGIIRYIFLIVLMVLIKLLSYFAKEGVTVDVFYIIDRVCENIVAWIIIVLICIGKKGFYILFCSKRKINKIDLTQIINKEKTGEINLIMLDSDSIL